jgi:uncharacterized surface protein with fasciclin (FAS1) repeats
VSEPVPPPLAETQTGRFVVVGLVMSLAFLLVAAAIWLAGGGSGARSDALAPNAPAIARPAEPAVAGVASSLPVSTLPLSSYPLPAAGLVMTDVAQAAPAPPPATAAPLVTEAVATSVADATTTTTVAATTISPTTLAATTTTAPATTVASSTTSPPTPTSTTTTAAPPATTVPGPVVTSPAAADATLLDVVRETPDLSRLRELVDISGFAPELDAARALTFLAPSNDAVAAWSATPEGEATLANPDAVYDLLLRHLVPEALDEATMFTRSSLDTVSGARLVVRQQSHTIDGANLLVADVTAANGSMHVVSDVLTGT